MAAPLPVDSQEEEILDLEEMDLLVWRAPERVQKERSKEFFSTVVVLALLVGLIMFFIEGLMPVLVIWAIVFAVWAVSKTPPLEVEHKLTTWGIRSANTLYRYSGMRQAWLEDKDGQRLLRVALARFPWQLNLIILPEQEKEIKRTLSAMQVPLLKPETTRVDRMVKWLGEKIPLEEAK